AWAVNVDGTARLVEAARTHRAVLVHVSSDYVFDGTIEVHTEDEPLSPLGVYGQTKAAADRLVATLPEHYIVRTRGVIGEGRNFVATMAGLAARGVEPTVVDDQIGRLTFAGELAAAIDALLSRQAPWGLYNVTGGGQPLSWAELAAEIFRLCGRESSAVTPVSTQTYLAGREGTGPRTPSPRPASSCCGLRNPPRTWVTRPWPAAPVICCSASAPARRSRSRTTAPAPRRCRGAARAPSCANARSRGSGCRTTSEASTSCGTPARGTASPTSTDSSG